MKASVFDEEIHVRSIGLAENATFAAEREQEQEKEEDEDEELAEAEKLEGEQEQDGSSNTEK